MEIKVKTKPKTISRKKVADKIKMSVDYVDIAVRMNFLDYAVLGRAKPVVINSKYETFIKRNKK